MKHTVIVDYGMGNFHSVARALQAAAPDQSIVIARRPAEVRAADRVVLPGQGALPDCMRTLRASGLLDAVREAARSKPLLGVCVGEQMLFEASDEGPSEGLGLFAGRVRRFAGPSFAARANPEGPELPGLKIPHMGWNAVHQVRPHALWAGIAQDAPFYFVHSYYAAPRQAALIAATSHYGSHFCCAVAADNIFAVQFHPEKSAACGLRLYHNFSHWQP